jgi:acyl carrier protein
MTIDTDSIRRAIHASVNRITGIATADIKDASTFREDLGLDSLSALEVMVDIEYAFKIRVPEERLEGVKTVADTIRVVQEFLGTVNA